jgi:PAS domain S-box-containing protein/putative nucleotidyltransferase with HDIG domain
MKDREALLDFFQNSPDGYHSLGPDGTILEVNATWLEMLGYQRNEVVGRLKLRDLLTPQGQKIYDESFPLLRNAGTVNQVEFELRRKDGSFLPVQIRASGVFDSRGQFVQSRALVRDNALKLDYEKKLLNAAQEWRTTFDSMPYGTMLIDSEFRILRANKYLARHLGLPIKELLGRRCYEVVLGGQQPDKDCALLKTMKTGQQESGELYHETSGRYFREHVSPILDGMEGRYVLFLADITDQKTKEEDLIQSRLAFFNMLKDLDSSYQELKELYEGLIHAFVNSIDAKSAWTGGHSEKVTDYALQIAKELALDTKEMETLRIAGYLHDIGKLGTYQTLLDKAGPLTPEEFAIVKLHPAKGEEILRPIKPLRDLLPIIRHHHERIDGKGYPDGLKGEAIPFLARILCVADSYEAMVSHRPYRPALGREQAIAELKRCSGTQFDPLVVEAFLRTLEDKAVE